MLIKNVHLENQTLVSIVGGYYDTTTPDALHVNIESYLLFVTILFFKEEKQSKTSTKFKYFLNNKIV